MKKLKLCMILTIITSTAGFLLFAFLVPEIWLFPTVGKYIWQAISLVCMAIVVPHISIFFLNFKDLKEQTQSMPGASVVKNNLSNVRTDTFGTISVIYGTHLNLDAHFRKLETIEEMHKYVGLPNGTLTPTYSDTQMEIRIPFTLTNKIQVFNRVYLFCRHQLDRRWQYFRASFGLPKTYARALIMFLILLSIHYLGVNSGEIKSDFIVFISLVVSFYIGRTSFKRGEDKSIHYDIYEVDSPYLIRMHYYMTGPYSKFIILFGMLVIFFIDIAFVFAQPATVDFQETLIKIAFPLVTYLVGLGAIDGVFTEKEEKKPPKKDYRIVAAFRTAIAISFIVLFIWYFSLQLTYLSSEISANPTLKNTVFLLQTSLNSILALFFGTAEK